MTERLLAAGVAALIFASACVFASACAPGDDDPYTPPPTYTPTPQQQTPGTPAQQGTTPAATPSPAAPAPQAVAPVVGPTAGADVGAPAPLQPGAIPVPPASTPVGTLNPVGSAPAPTPAPQGSPATGGAGATTGGAGVATGTEFNAGSGVLQPDGKTVVYRIPDGTGGNDWNSKTKPIRVKRGMTLRLIDDDKSTAAGGHWLHTYGQPCPHSSRAIGTGYDCVIGQQAPLGIVSGVAEHNIFNGIGYLYIEVVAN
jgi:hypothetical protein